MQVVLEIQNKFNKNNFNEVTSRNITELAEQSNRIQIAKAQQQYRCDCKLLNYFGEHFT